MTNDMRGPRSPLLGANEPCTDPKGVLHSMKKLLLILLAALLLLSAGCGKQEAAAPEDAAAPEASAAPEEPVYEPLPEAQTPLMERLPGEWYAGYQGLVLTLTLSEDGSYAFRVPGVPLSALPVIPTEQGDGGSEKDSPPASRNDAIVGAWALEDGLVALDGGAGGTLLPVDGVLLWTGADMLFTREMPEVYAPAEINAKTQPGDLDGYWKSHFVAVGEGTVLASALGETTDIYIERERVALGGPLFGDVIVDAVMKDGVLTYEAEGVAVSLALQQDGFLRLNVEGENPVTVYLLPAVPGWAEPDDAEPETREG